jgi:hypothetical protein
VPAPEGPFPAPGEGALACEQPGEVIAELTNQADTDAWLTRRWVYCSGDNLFGTPHSGIEFASDGRWYFLDLVGGELVRRQGFTGGGDWYAFENGWAVQVVIDSWKGGGTSAFLRFAVSPVKVSLNAVAEHAPQYVAVAPAP